MSITPFFLPDGCALSRFCKPMYYNHLKSTPDRVPSPMPPCRPPYADRKNPVNARLCTP
ncbi:MAG: hypothetical protein IKG88_04565 [Bacteroidales bacterium]|nr:hypothetical protein [Bacteroidales bacterium]